MPWKHVLGPLCLFALMLSAGSPAWAGTVEQIETVQVGPFQIREEVEMLAYLRSRRLAQQKMGQALSDAVPELRQQLSLRQITALGMAFFETETLHLDESQAIKSKIFVDVDVTPENLLKFWTDNRFLMDYIQMHMDWVQQTESGFDAYLRLLSAAPNTGIAEALHQSQGTRLKAHYTSIVLLVESTHLLALGRHRETLSKLAEVVELAPDYHGGHYLRGIAYLLDKQYDSALQALGRAIALQPGSDSLYFLRGLTYLAQGVRYDHALADLEQVIQLNPQHAQAYYLRGVAHHHNGHCDQAKRDYDKACELGYGKACSLDCSPQAKPNRIRADF